MNKKIYFCKSWFRAKKKPTEIWSEDQARIAHLHQKNYTVLVESLEMPFCFIDISKGVVGVGFLDERLREKLTYAFQEFEPGKLFLITATYREFDGEADRVVGGTSYLFEQEGSVEIRREFFDPHMIETKVAKVDVSGNYSLMPEFACYSDLIRVERS